jgi:hypothetical protein
MFDDPLRWMRAQLRGDPVEVLRLIAVLPPVCGGELATRSLGGAIALG